MAQLYILYNQVADKFYVGATSNLDLRILEHNKGSHKTKFTRKQKGKWQLVYFEEYDNIREARSREQIIKKWKSRERIEKLVEQSQL